MLSNSRGLDLKISDAEHTEQFESVVKLERSRSSSDEEPARHRFESVVKLERSRSRRAVGAELEAFESVVKLERSRSGMLL